VKVFHLPAKRAAGEFSAAALEVGESLSSSKKRHEEGEELSIFLKKDPELKRKGRLFAHFPQVLALIPLDLRGGSRRVFDRSAAFHEL
jgi:hypothetical protein